MMQIQGALNVAKHVHQNSHLYLLGGLVGSAIFGGLTFQALKARRDPQLQIATSAYDESLRKIRPNQNIKFYTVNKQFFRQQPSENFHDLEHILAAEERSI
jgi:hypothetical protein